MRRILFYIFISVTFLTYGNDLSDGYDLAVKAVREQSVDSAKIQALHLLEMAKKESDHFYLVKSYFLLGWLSAKTEDYGDAVIYYLEAARFAELNPDYKLKKELISIYKNLGSLVGDYSHYELAHRFIDKGISVAEELNNELQITSLLHNKVHQFLEDKKFEEALKQINFILDNYELDKERVLKLKNKAGIALKNLGELDKAKESYQYILKDDPNINIEEYAYSMNNIAYIYLKQGNTELAFDYYLKTIAFEKQHNLVDILPVTYVDIAAAYMNSEEYETALTYLKEAEHLDQTASLNPEIYKIYELISDVHYQLGNGEKALMYKSIYSTRLEEYILEQQRIEELDKKFNIQLLTERYFDLLAANEEQQETERMAKLSLGGVTSLFVLILTVIYYRQRRIKQAIRNEILKIEALSKV